jgi:hypothetical protein
MRDPKERLRDMLKAIAAIERHLGRGRAAFEHDRGGQRGEELEGDQVEGAGVWWAIPLR